MRSGLVPASIDWSLLLTVLPFHVIEFVSNRGAHNSPTIPHRFGSLVVSAHEPAPSHPCAGAIFATVFDHATDRSAKHLYARTGTWEDANVFAG